jgi:hypothetical protein
MVTSMRPVEKRQTVLRCSTAIHFSANDSSGTIMIEVFEHGSDTRTYGIA